MNSLEKIATLVENNPPEISKDSLQRGRARFIEATRQGGASRTLRASWLWAGPFAVTCAFAVWAIATRAPSAPPVAIAPTPVASHVRLEVPAQGPSLLELEPGTSVELSQGTLAYASTTAPGRRRVELVRGKLRLSVDPARHTAWTVSAGTVEVSVVGTIFSVERDEVSKDVRVAVERGVVQVVSGADRSRQVRLEAGQSAVARAERLDVTGSADPVPTHEPKAGSAPELTGVVPPALGPSAQELFQSRYRARDYRGALAAAEQAGFTDLLRAWDRAALSRLADAARLAGEPSRAQQALERLRERFPGSRESADAAFLLGRLHADSLKAPASAARWFERYLAEMPSGSYAQEAQGRWMVAARTAGDIRTAQGVASTYLERYPKGPYASTAASLVR